jgi:gamma-glutamylcyclotransferase (GGCT)/AIG2-like uncharacterized protein YtfP
MADTGATFLLFVYGTLMRGGLRHAVLADQRFLRQAVTRPNYLLLDLGAYPGMIAVPQGGRPIPGELYEVERALIPRLDQIEGAPELYRLEPVVLEGETAPGYAYLYRGSTEGARTIERWVNG